MGGGGQESQLKIIREFEERDSRIKCLSIAEGGQGPARNYGMDRVSGKWLTFVDADDDVSPEWLSNYAKVFQDNLDIICAEYCHNLWMKKTLQLCRIGCDKAIYYSVFRDPKIFLPLVLKQEHIVAPPWNKMFSMQFLRDNAIRFRSEIYEDYIFNFEAAVRCHSMAVIPNGGYQYNVSFDAGVMARYSKTHEEGGLLRIDRWCKALDASGNPASKTREMKLRMLHLYSMEELLNTFRLGTPHTFSTRLKIVITQFAKPWMNEIKELNSMRFPTLLERLFDKFYRLNAQTMCVLTFSAMHWVRRNMKGVSAILLRHLG